MRHGRWHAAMLGALVTLGAGGARAQEPAPAPFGMQGHFVITAERLFGFVYSDQTQTTLGVDRTSKVTSISLLGNSLSLLTLYDQPRLAADWFPAAHFSVGLSASYAHSSTSDEIAAGMPASTTTYTGYVVAPRIGYALPLSPAVSLWPRIGFTFAHLGLELPNATATSATSLYAVTIEAPFVFVLAPHLYLYLAPTLDLGVGGSTTSTGGNSGDDKETEFGVLAGLGGYL